MTKIVSKFGWGIAAIIVFLIVIMVFIAALSADANGQTVNSKVGFNAPNAVESFTTQADSNYLIELVPAGASFSWRDRYDKLNESPEQIIDLYKFMQKSNRGFWDIFVCADSIPLQQNISAIATLKAAGVPVLAVSYVNEPFYPAGGYNFNWSLYEPGYTAFCEAITANWPEMDILLPIAPKPLSIFTKTQGGQTSHDNWNNAGFSFKSEHPEFNISGGDIHIYYTGAFVAALGVTATTDEVGAEKAKTTVPVSRVYTTADTTDEAYWRNIYTQSQPAVFWEPMLSYLQSHGLQAYVTECGYIDAGSLNGTYTYAAKAFELTNWYGEDPRINSFNFHGGPITQSTVGVVGPRKKWDVADAENLNNCRSATFDAFSLYFNAPGKRSKYGNSIITQPGVYSLWYLNSGAEFSPSVVLAEGLTAEMYTQYIKGNIYSSLSRSMEFTKKNSVLSASEVSGITTGTTCPTLSFGYVIVTVTASDVPGCTDENALNYNPSATVDDGSCIARVYGCMDPTATNYDPAANTDSGMCVVITVQCYQKRWLFKSLPCKPAKRNCNCNE